MSALNASERKAIDREIDLLFTLPPHRNVLQIFGNIEVYDICFISTFRNVS